AGVYAVGWLRGRRDHYHRLGFAVPFTIAAVATPIQFVLGDSIARSVFHKQPVKFAALEIVWKTDTRVPEYLFGRLNEDGTVSGGIKIPLLDSVLAGFSPNTEVVGLTSVPADQRPTAKQATIAHWAFDIMVLIGSVLVLLALWYG
ncbi:cytochrome ubiquinol oxidase subunit I, partial [Streptomyces stackebrandtii]|uniref:cytochrome ubiquinol oxidase subunit I n=1 Tax=Streptomyces stackebrandtii TaxID=3051177 RepID=UPI0028DC7D92